MTALRTLSSLLLIVVLAGCTSTIVPPDKPAEPVSVFVLDHGRHSSLVLPLGSGPEETAAAVRYSYGDWDYYVLRDTGFWQGLRALVPPTPAALGRQYLRGPYNVDALVEQIPVEVVDSFEIEVNADDVRALREELHAKFEAGAEQERHRWPSTNIEFVRHPQDYTLMRNSNQMIADWLEMLGCTVRGKPILSNWRIEPPAPES